MVKANFKDQVHGVLESLLEGEGFELVLVDYVQRQKILRVFIDHLDPERAQAEAEDGKAGVTISDCTRVSRLCSDVLDAEGLSDGVEGDFTFEVSSPGMDRPLTKLRHFERVLGQMIRVVTKKPPLANSGQRKFEGALRGASDSSLDLEVDGKLHTFDLTQIDKANVVPQF